MKKNLTYLVAAVALGACSSENFVGNEPTVNEEKEVAIVFGGQAGNITRANYDGATAAGMLGNNFLVEGVKGDGTFDSYAGANEIFDHYNVNYIDNSANTTTSNNKGWEYVGQTISSLTAANKQTIKYWDYSASQYDYVAFSYGTSNQTDLTLSAMDYNKIGTAVSAGTPVYTVKGSTANLTKAYVADLVTVYKADFGTTTVTPAFRSMGSKVRLAFFETIPGYAVKDVKFYVSASDAAPTATPVLYADNNVLASGAGTMSVYYPTVGAAKVGDDDYNQAHVTFTADAATDLTSLLTFANGLKYTTAEAGVNTTTHGTDYLGTTSSTATYATADTKENAYHVVLPTGTGNELNLRVDYTLVPTDGGAENITVHSATAVVPAAYTEWKPNYAYTYMFKISDNTNGWTDPTVDVAGLCPITFDAVVIETTDGVQEIITGVTTPSITTYQMGKVITTNNEYVAGDIYACVQGNPVLSAANAHLYIVTGGSAAATVSEATAALAVAQGKTDSSTDVFDKTNVELTQVYPAAADYVTTVPGADGNTLAVNALRIGATSGKTYVFEYVNGTNKTYKVIRVQ